MKVWTVTLTSNYSYLSPHCPSNLTITLPALHEPFVYKNARIHFPGKHAHLSLSEKGVAYHYIVYYNYM